VVFPGALASALCALSGDVGGGALIRRDATLARGVRLVEARRAAELMDVDTPEDLARVAGELGRLARPL
jgi:molybdenum cofactor cytidylyltransferase